MDKILNKLLSGRWILTVVCAIVFYYATMAGMLKSETVSAIVSMVFISYFQRRRTEEDK